MFLHHYGVPIIPLWSVIIITYAQKKDLRKCKLYTYTVQGPPSGFDIMYLALAGRNIQVRFGLKVDWES